jgi:hypothetical protein
MPTSMVQRRLEILALIAAGKSNIWITKHYGHGRPLIRKVRETLARDPSQIDILHHVISAPEKITPAIMVQIDDLIATNCQMPSAGVAQILTEMAICQHSPHQVFVMFGTHSGTNPCRRSQLFL